MRSYGSFVYGAVLNCIELAKRPVKGRWSLVLSYGRMVVKFLVLVRGLGRKVQQEKFLGYTVSFVDYEAFLYLFSEIFMRREYAFVAERNDPLIIDCGANIGLATLFFKWTYPKSRVVAFEPNSAAFARLEENVRRNKVAGVEVYNLGVSDKEGIVKLYGSAGALTASMLKERGGTQEQQMRVVPLSRFMTKRVDLLKMDIEGAETGVMADLDRKKKLGLVRMLIMEYHHNIPKSRWSQMAQVLEKNGFVYNVRAMWNNAHVGAMQDLLIYGIRK